MSNNPGKVVTKFQFSALFCKAWQRAMVPSNIIAGFRITGVFPVDRSIILSGSLKESATSRKCSVPFLTQHSPVRKSYYRPPHSLGTSSLQSTPQRSLEVSLDSTCTSDSSIDEESVIKHKNKVQAYHQKMCVCASSKGVSFSADEVVLFSKRMREGYDIQTDQRYSLWLELHQEKVQNLGSSTILSKVIEQKATAIKMAALPKPSSTSRVITSKENRERLKAIQEKKQLEAERKEAAREERKKRRKKKKRNAKLGEKNRENKGTAED